MLNFSRTVLGIELGTTRIKAVLLDENHAPVASGSHVWENRLENGIWTYSLEDIVGGVQSCYADLRADIRKRTGEEPTTFGAIGVSAMMHGYLPLDKTGVPLAPFRTWRNTVTGEASEKLTELFRFHIPQRWTIAHLYQSMLSGEEHVARIGYLTTLAGYVHWRLTGEKKVGLGEASGIFPLDSETLGYDAKMTEAFEALPETKKYPWRLADILPEPVPAGEIAGYLTEAGARFLDPTGTLQAGIPVAPCEGDAGTGMTATNSVRACTGNVSAGTSAFAMLVADHPLGVHREVDMVTTPTGLPVAMVHCSNCTSDINGWVSLFSELAEAAGLPIDRGELYTLFFRKALEGDADAGGLLSYNYFSGEGVTAVNEGRPLFVRTPESAFTLANFCRMHLLSALSTLRIGLDILRREENVHVERICAHGGFFKTPGVGQRILAAAVGAPVSVMETAGEGGPYGMALLCAYMLWRRKGESLEEYLDNRVFADAGVSTVLPDSVDAAGFTSFLERYKAAFPLERLAVETLKMEKNT